MKRLLNRLYRALILVLALMPAASMLMRILMSSLLTGVIWFAAQTALMALIALVPAFIGNYNEYEVVTYEGARGSDPNPDREAVRSVVREGHRFPLRLACDGAALVLLIVLALIVPGRMFMGASLVNRILFLLLAVVLMLVAAQGLPSAAFLWGELPGIVIGGISYLAIAVYMYVSKADLGALKPLISVCAVLYLFVGSVELNRQSIMMSMSAHMEGDKRIPRLIAVRNRRIVLTFAAVVTVVSVAEPVRRAIMWLLTGISKLLGMLGRLLGGKGASDVQPLMMPTAVEAVAPSGLSEVEAVSESSVFQDILVYAFFGVVIIALLVLIFDGLKKLSDKLTKWMERFIQSVGEGFYDEKEELMTSEEMRERLKDGVRKGLASLFARETPWKELSGREQARRLMKNYYKKRAGKLTNLKKRTAREVVDEMSAPESVKSAFIGAYERARYSDHDVEKAETEQLKKNLKL